MSIVFVTGTDTGVGKTLLTVLMTRHLRSQGIPVVAVKPFCSGGRSDARALRDAQDRNLSLDAVNPWHFRAPLAPWVAARREGQNIRLAEAVAFLRRNGATAGNLLVEGAGGLLSPLGQGFSNRELIEQLHAIPLVVCPNRLGAINQVLLVLNALPRQSAIHAQVVLMAPPRPSLVARVNSGLIRELSDPARVHDFPWLRGAGKPARVRLHPPLDQRLRALAAACAMT